MTDSGRPHAKAQESTQPPPASRFEALRDAAVAELPKVCPHHRPCMCRRRLIEKFIYVGLALADQGWTVKP